MSSTEPLAVVEDKPFTVFNHVGMHMPNLVKILFLMKELNLKYDCIYLDFNKNEQKLSPHIDYNPNGRIPTMIDHTNNNFPVWESNAILLYLMGRYDPDNKTGFLGKTPEERSQVMTWLFFQASGQAPYYGQAHWFMYLHPEEVPSAITRYQDEIIRVMSVLDGHLKDRNWIVGDAVTIADFSMLPYNIFYAPRLMPEGIEIEDKFPNVAAWHRRMLEKQSVAQVVAEREAEIKRYPQTIPIFRGERARMEPVFPLISAAA